MKTERAALHVLSGYPEFYLASEGVIFVEVNNASAEPITVAAFRDLLNKLESNRLVLSQSVQGFTKWKITGAGRAWLKEA